MKTQSIVSGRPLLATLIFALVVMAAGCASAPEPARGDSASGTAQAEAADAAAENQEIENLREEVARLEEELRSLRQDEAGAARPGGSAEVPPGEQARSVEGRRAEDDRASEEPTPDAQQLRRENERLRDLVEELRLALTAVGVDAPPAETPTRAGRRPEPSQQSARPEATDRPAPASERQPPEQPPPEDPPEVVADSAPGSPAEPAQEPDSAAAAPAATAGPAAASASDAPDAATDPTAVRAPAPTPSTGDIAFRRVNSVTPPLEDRTPSQLREQRILRIPTGAGGYAYVDERANSSDGEGLYLELHLLPDMQVPEVRLRATAVYPVENSPLRFSGFSLAEGEELFEFRVSQIDRRRGAGLAAETLTAPMQPELRRLLVFLQRRPMAELLLTFHGAENERSHRVTRNELLALGNMIYTMREMGVDL